LTATALTLAAVCAPLLAQVDARVLERRGLPGVGAETERWIVTFTQRSFDLAEFRRACHDRAAPAQATRIVTDLERRVVADQEPFTRAIEQLGGRITHRWWLINGCAFEVPRRALPQVITFANLATMEPDAQVAPAGAPIAVSTNNSNHRTDSMQGTFQGTGLGIAIMDTGLDASMNNTGSPHRIFYLNGVKPGVNLLAANIQVGAITAEDQHGHGTAVAGVAAGATWTNAAADFGHAYNATKVGFSVCDAVPGCGANFSTLTSAWQQIAANKLLYNIQVANNSYSGSPDATTATQQALDSAAFNADILITVAAGNNGPAAGSTVFSQSCANGLAVAACAATSKAIASFSSRGPMSGDPLRTYPDITACGVNLTMPLRDNESGFLVDSGTSYAAPAVAGTAVLVRQADPTATALETKAILLANTENIAVQNPGGNVNWYGTGFLRTDLAVTQAQTTLRTFTDAMYQGVVRTYTMGVTQNQACRVALTWHRSDFTTTAWNDLNLEVLNGTTVIASSLSPRNLWERVSFNAPITGSLTIRVTHTGTLTGIPQAFAVSHNGTPASGSTATFTFFAAGCQGSNNAVPLHTVTGLPRLGTTMTFDVAQAIPNTQATLVLGFSNTSWNGISLPYSFAGQGAPLCFGLVAADLTFVVGVNAAGTASLPLAVPNFLSFVGVPFYTQYLITDALANPVGYAFSRGGAGVLGNL
jgi:hypothetical protein